MIETNNPITAYEKRSSKYRDLQRSFCNKCRLISSARLLIALLIIGLLLNNNILSTGNEYYLFLGAASIAFIVLVIMHHKYSSIEKEYSILLRINNESHNKVTGKWVDNDVTELHDIIPDQVTNNLLVDMGVIGDRSLLQYIGSINTRIGFDTFTKWICNVEDLETIISRQDSIKELSSRIDQRQRIQMEIIKSFSDSDRKNDSKSDYSKILLWLESSDNDKYSKNVIKSMLCVSLLFPLSLASSLYSFQSGVIISGTLLFLNIIMFLLFINKAHHTFDRAGNLESEIKKYSEICKFISESDYKSTYLKTIKEKIENSENNTTAHDQLLKIGHIVGWSEIRHGGMSYFILNSIFLVDALISLKLMKWKEENKPYVCDWISSCGEFELLVALSEIDYNNPNWFYPVLIDSNSERLIAKDLAHPLIDKKVRVGNDVALGPTGNVLLVTGSNMSGKSTLLRTIGLNLLLARLGSPVCAKYFETPIVDVVSSFRVNDSLMDGVSLFMAELKQISNIIDKIKKNKLANRLTVAFFDEILQGTNSKERALAVTHIIKELLKNNCILVISTHDLELGTSKDLDGVFSPVHFKENIEEHNDNIIMTFDYILREGISNTKNAMKLLQAVGIKKGLPVNLCSKELE